VLLLCCALCAECYCFLCRGVWLCVVWCVVWCWQSGLIPTSFNATLSTVSAASPFKSKRGGAVILDPSASAQAGQAQAAEAALQAALHNPLDSAVPRTHLPPPRPGQSLAPGWRQQQMQALNKSLKKTGAEPSADDAGTGSDSGMSPVLFLFCCVVLFVRCEVKR
jgi:hypothetical protein